MKYILLMGYELDAERCKVFDNKKDALDFVKLQVEDDYDLDPMDWTVVPFESENTLKFDLSVKWKSDQ